MVLGIDVGIGGGGAGLPFACSFVGTVAAGCDCETIKTNQIIISFVVD